MVHIFINIGMTQVSPLSQVFSADVKLWRILRHQLLRFTRASSKHLSLPKGFFMTGSPKDQAFPRERQQLGDVACRDKRQNSHVKYTQEKIHGHLALINPKVSHNRYEEELKAPPKEKDAEDPAEELLVTRVKGKETTLTQAHRQSDVQRGDHVQGVDY